MYFINKRLMLWLACPAAGAVLIQSEDLNAFKRKKPQVGQI